MLILFWTLGLLHNENEYTQYKIGIYLSFTIAQLTLKEVNISHVLVIGHILNFMEFIEKETEDVAKQ